MTITTTSILGQSGRIARRLKEYEQRPEQLEMAEAVESAIANGDHLLVEAGTGVGKSFAYLVPALLAANKDKQRQRNQNRDASGEPYRQTKEKRKPVVVSTNTISLQEQLIARDIPFLNSVLPIEFTAVLVKGRSNYISLRRLKGAMERAGAMFARPEEADQLQKVMDWSKRTTDGSRADLDFQPLYSVWDEVESDRGNCLGRKCPTYKKCFYYAARRRATNADLLVVNHALFFSDLALRREGASILPDYDTAILDEAHTVEAVAGDHLGIAVSSGQLEYQFGKLYNPNGNRGLLVHHRLVQCQRMVHDLRDMANNLFWQLRTWQKERGPSNGRVRQPPPVENRVSPKLQELAVAIRKFAEKLKAEEDKIELTAAADRCEALALDLSGWMKQQTEDAVYWIEEGGRRRQLTKLVCTPIEIGHVLRDELFNQVGTVVLTSATLAVGKGDFGFIKNRLGLTKARELKLGSPFDYRAQAKLVIPRDMPDPAAGPATTRPPSARRSRSTSPRPRVGPLCCLRATRCCGAVPSG